MSNESNKTKHRNRRVLGGDFEGLSHRKSRFGFLARLNIANWIAIGIVTLIAFAFLWPHKSSRSTQEVIPLASANTVGVYQEPRVEEQPNDAQLQPGFSRENDILRANNYRQEEEKKQKIENLLTQADQHLQNGRYTIPVDENALAIYREVEKLDENNDRVREGTTYIKNRFLESGKRSIDNADVESAESTLERLAYVDSESSQHLELADLIGRFKIDQEIENLLSQANAALRAKQLILPARRNALHFFQQIKTLDANNQAALDGINQIIDVFIERSNRAMIAGEYEAASGYVATVAVISPEHEAIKLMQQMIAQAEPLAAELAKRPQTPAETINTTTASPISTDKTPTVQSNEQEKVDQQYLERGLNAYYEGDYERAANLLMPLADKGISRAQLRLGYMHYLGRGFSQNRSEADRIIRAALPAVQKFAEEGRSWAQSDIGSLYEDGLVLPKDLDKAVFWYRLAALKGYAGAQTNLGSMYALGRGVTRNEETAIDWFRRAARQGDNVAMRNLEALGADYLVEQSSP